MVQCSRCGKPSPEGAVHCPYCGSLIQGYAPPPLGSAAPPARTFVAQPPPNSPPLAQPTASPLAASPKATLLGVRRDVPGDTPQVAARPPAKSPQRLGSQTQIGHRAEAVAAPAPPPSVGNQTMMGHAAPRIPQAPYLPPAAVWPAQVVQPAAPSYPAPAYPAPQHAQYPTQIQVPQHAPQPYAAQPYAPQPQGYAPQPQAPQHFAAHPVQAGPSARPAAPGPQLFSPQLPGPQLPHPQLPRAQPPSPLVAGPAPLPLHPANGAAGLKSREERARARRKRDPLQQRGVFPAMSAPARRSDPARLSHWLLGAALVALSSALLTVVMVGMSKQVEAEVSAEGTQEYLELHCERCANGSKVLFDNSEAQFQNRIAKLPLATLLPVGMNQLKVKLVKGNWFGDQTVNLDVPVHYRLRARPEGLASIPPKLSIEVEAADGTEVLVENQAVAISAGRGKLELDLSAEFLGAATENSSWTRQLNYKVRPKDARAYAGRLEVRYAAPALVVDAPGPLVVTDAPTFALAGHTAPGAWLRLDGRPLVADGQGAFAHLLNIDSVGETTVWLSAGFPEQAARRFPIRVRRVQDLQAEAALFAATASENYARVAADPEQERGLAVAFAGQIERIREQGNVTKALLSVTSGCSGRCLAQLIQPGRVKFKERARVVAYGHVAGSAEVAKGQLIPELRTLYILPASRAAR
jgi:hypothetical protein